LPLLLAEKERLEHHGGSDHELCSVTRRIERAESHQNHAAQRVYLSMVLENLKNEHESALFAQDFTSMAAQDTEGGMLNDLIIYLTWYDRVAGCFQALYIDIIARNITEAMDFVMSAWLFLIDDTDLLKPFKRLYGFSDGPNKQYKNRYLAHFFGALFASRSISVDYSFFFAHHGRFRCDAHASCIKRQLDALYREREGQIEMHRKHHFLHTNECSAIFSCFQFSLSDYVERFNTKISRTHAFVLPFVMSFPRGLSPPLHGIFDAHQIQYDYRRDGIIARLYGISGQPDTFIGSFFLPLLAFDKR